MFVNKYQMFLIIHVIQYEVRYWNNLKKDWFHSINRCLICKKPGSLHIVPTQLLYYNTIYLLKGCFYMQIQFIWKIYWTILLHNASYKMIL